MAQRTVLHYQLGEKLGAGGMGEVYKARDTRLNRVVAVKVLSPSMSADPDRRRRFVQEAQAASALNHPNIITIFDIIEDSDAHYMVIEYVDGKTLLELIPEGGMPVPEVLRYATQMAKALSAAHAAGVIHRDLKPANVMVTGAGLVKVLDFGLAKMTDWASADPNGVTVTMQSNPLTVEGTLLGTVNYMSPEQAEGRRTDARSDIFSFGAVLYEMLTGQRAFSGDTVMATITAVLRDRVRPIRELSPEVPADLERLVDQCLEKNPDERAQSFADIHASLSALKQEWVSGTFRNPAPAASIGSQRPARKRLAPLLIVWTFTAAAVAATGYWWVSSHRSGSPDRPPAPLRASPAPIATANDGAAGSPIIPPTPEPATTVPVILDDGLLVRLTLDEDIPADAKEGDPIQFMVSRDVRVDRAVVIRKGAAAGGAIVDSPRKGLLGIGKGVKMTLRLDRVEAADGQKVPIRATPAHSPLSKRAVDNGAKKSKDIAAEAGTEYFGYVDGTKTVAVKR